MSSRYSFLWVLTGRLLYWLSWPARFPVMYFSKRTRILVTSGDKVLLVKGWLGDGEWTLPGGGLHIGEDPAAGAARELKEETGLEVRPGQLNYVSTDRVWENGTSYIQLLYVMQLQKAAAVKRQKWELIAAEWFSPMGLRNIRVAHTSMKQIVAERLKLEL